MTIATLAEQSGYECARLVGQLKWYEEKSANRNDWYLRLKIVQIVIAATIPLSRRGRERPDHRHSGRVDRGARRLPAAVPAVARTGCYRETADALKHQKFFYPAQAGSYSDATAAAR
jgi:hypothetical protein